MAIYIYIGNDSRKGNTEIEELVKGRGDFRIESI